MPQIALIQPAAPQVPPPSPPANNDNRNFSPHLNQAIAGRKDQSPSRESADKANEQTASDKKNISNNELPDTATNKTESGRDTANAKEVSEAAVDNTKNKEQTTEQSNIVIFMTAVQTVNQPVCKIQTDSSAIQTLNQQLTNNSSPLFEFLAKNTANGTGVSGQQETLSQKSLQNSSEESLFSSPLAEAMGVSAAKKASVPLGVQASGAKSESNGLLQQLQKIIDNSNESGNISITVTGNTGKEPSGLNGMQTTIPGAVSASNSLPPAVTSPSFTEVAAGSSITLLPNSSDIPVDKANQSLTSLRHSIQQQYYEGKFALQNDKEKQTSSENAQQDNTFTPKGSPTLEGTALSSLKQDQTSTFDQPLVLAIEGQKQPTVEALRPVTLPSGNVVQQQDVIRQITEHFQISRRDNDTQINIKLYPAELGELKIDLSLKGGSVRANVVASSQYAQEIIEKNMGKLRTILESQGFTIDDISVTAKSDTTKEFNLFDKQLFSQNDYTPSSTKTTRPPGGFFTMEDSGANVQAAATGVNVKI